MSSASAFTAVKLLGAGYLVLVGVQRIRHAGDDGDPAGDDVVPTALRRVYMQGVVVNVLNSKTALFFLAFLPQFVDPARGHVAPQVVVLGAMFILLGTDGTYAIVAGGLGERLKRSARFARRRDRVSGAVFITLGATAALAGHPVKTAA